MHGSLRQRSAGSWELRVFIGTDPDTGRRIDRSITVRGTRPDAERALADLIASAVGDLLEAWFEIGATGRSPTTIRQHRSVLRCYLFPCLGHFRVGDVTVSMINRMYVELRAGGGVGGRELIDAVTGRRLAEHAQQCRRSDDGFLFGDKSGEVAWKPNRVTKTFGRHVRAAGLRRVRLHDLRHFMATQMLNRKVPIVVVARRLDHRRVSTTLDIYTHAMPGSDAAAADTMADVMYGPEPTPDTSSATVRLRRVGGRLAIRRPQSQDRSRSETSGPGKHLVMSTSA